MHKTLTLVTLLFIGSLQLAGQTIDSKAIDGILAEYVEDDGPGFSIGIIEDGKMAYAKGYGKANLDYGIPNTKESVFRIASTSKQFTAACIVLLAQQGKLSLKDSLTHFFPDFPKYGNKITVRHLLNHTSGVRDYLMLSYLAGLGDSDYYTDIEVMAWLKNQNSLNFDPNADYVYSNSGYWLLGQIVKKASGLSLAEYAHKNLFAPLSMENTHFHDNPNQIVKNRATGYSKSKKGYQENTTTLPMVGDGGVYTTVVDFKKWVDEYFKPTHLDKKFWEEMTRTGVLNDGKEIKYASGLVISEYKEIKSISHGGSFVGFLSKFILFPEENVSIVIFTNCDCIDPYDMSDKVIKTIFKEKLPEEETAPKEQIEYIILNSSQLKKYAGDYEVQPGVLFNVSLKNDTLQATQKWNGSQYPIIPISETEFMIPEVDAIKFSFKNIEDGKAQILAIDQAGNTTEAKRKGNTPKAEIDLNQYIGTFYSIEVQSTYKLTVEGGKLKFEVKNQEPMELLSIGSDKFRSGPLVFKFQKPEGTVTGFTIDAGRVKGVQFEKM